VYLCNFIWIYSIRNFIQYTTVFKFIQYQNETLHAITFNHLPRHLSQLSCPRQFLGHLLLARDQNNMSFRSFSSCWNCTWALRLAFLSGSFTIDTVLCHSGFCFLLLTLLFSIEHHPVFETSLHNVKNQWSKPYLILKILPQIPNNFKQFLIILPRFNQFYFNQHLTIQSNHKHLTS